MNERITQLAKQAEAAYIPRYDMWQMDTETLSNFAELIIRDCILACHKHEDINGTPFDCIREIKEHFGVE